MQSKGSSSYLPSILRLPAGFGTVSIGFRCRGVIGPVPQPLWIRNIIQLIRKAQAPWSAAYGLERSN
jgi:hypothetical protein